MADDPVAVAVEEPLSTVDEVAARTGEPIESPDDIKLAESMIEAASANVRHYGKPWPIRAGAPAMARTIATAAAARGYLNPSGFIDERSDSVTLKRAEAYAADTELTPREIKQLEDLAGETVIHSISISQGEDRWRPRSIAPGFMYLRRDPGEAVAMDDRTTTPFPFFVRHSRRRRRR
ncbi:hypothetical protein [Brevibacterium moorei]|uniref:hypothetical protein n=1 Tax=Brevibacterium moorei TaxID=2968457 RepID=UPI00211B867E|nr:hypothetical protein [Brevibacterium sp. 68QC2CO]MCQ9385121.1 hypothetical protein [Brevibacterium sp. 68QC2CO]